METEKKSKMAQLLADKEPLRPDKTMELNTQKQAAYVAFKSLRNLTKGPKLLEAGGR